MTVISSAILRQLGVPVQGHATVHTTAGVMAVELYEVSLGVTDFGLPNAPELVASTLRVMELTQVLPEVEILIGLDVLLTCRFRLDGPNRRFALEFDA